MLCVQVPTPYLISDQHYQHLKNHWFKIIYTLSCSVYKLAIFQPGFPQDPGNGWRMASVLWVWPVYSGGTTQAWAVLLFRPMFEGIGFLSSWSSQVVWLWSQSHCVELPSLGKLRLPGYCLMHQSDFLPFSCLTSHLTSPHWLLCFHAVLALAFLPSLLSQFWIPVVP